MKLAVKLVLRCELAVKSQQKLFFARVNSRSKLDQAEPYPDQYQIDIANQYQTNIRSNTKINIKPISGLIMVLKFQACEPDDFQ